MKFSENWLREWVNPGVDSAALGERLTIAGIELEGSEPAAPDLAGIVVAEITALEQHPDADRLRVCTVDPGDGSALQVVCGAPNVYAGMRAPFAAIGTRLPGGTKIRRSKLRGVVSEGMLCSAIELGLGEDADGLLELPSSATLGSELADYLDLNDTILEVGLTPNRGDCLSIAGLARDVGAIFDCPVTPPAIAPVPAQIDETLPVRLEAPAACPIYAGRIVRGIRPDARTPVWMKERLRRSGLRPIHPVVDITNYVMLELGQPMHAFDLRRLRERIVVRMARSGEPLTLLDGRELLLAEDELAICDAAGVKALAGVMGGEDSGVAEDTTDIFFESAFFAPEAIAGRALRYGLHTDAAHRFERGVEPGLQERAIERATALLLEIAGGRPGPLQVACETGSVPQAQPISLRRARIARLLGTCPPDAEIHSLLQRLQLTVEATADGWTATPPAFRFDLAIEEDLIEEVARIHGYDRIPEIDEEQTVRPGASSEGHIDLERIQLGLVDRGYQEAITYSFVEPGYQAHFLPGEPAVELANPISSDMSVLRRSLWPGLVAALVHNQRRQQTRIRLFECGVTFEPHGDERKEISRLGAVLCGDRNPEQWALRPEPVDFFDIKGDLEALFALTGQGPEFAFVAAEHPALHPGRCARVELAGAPIGWAGALHPRLRKALDVNGDLYLAEIDIAKAFAARVPGFTGIPDHPAIRRDIAVILPEEVTIAQIRAAVRSAAPASLRELRIFDIYRGQGIDSGRKSVALGLILQESSRTLTDGEGDSAVEAVLSGLQQEFEARIRD